ncbi:MAG: GAF domain-containing protein [Chloroflexi bacterium]|nr:GAF domain-containing protein [Chloroflexota bacterium]
MELALILFAGAAVVLIWIYLWASQRERLDESPPVDTTYSKLPIIGRRDGVFIVDSRGRVVYASDTLRSILNTSTLTVEQIARCTDPQDVFFDLLADEGQVTLQINRRWIQAESRRTVEKGETRTIVVMRDLAGAAEGETGYSPQVAFAIIDEIGETVNAAQGVEPVLQALLSIVRKHVKAEAGEITLWDEEGQILRPRGWVGESGYVLALAEAGGFYAQREGISGWIAQYRQPILVADSTADDAIRPKLPNSGYRSFIGIPLMMGERFLGTFELASTVPSAFDTSRLALLKNVSRSLATAIYNAELYAEQAQRVSDIAELQTAIDQQAMTSEPEAIFSALASRVARLLDAQMAGAMIYDEKRERLVPQTPFHGLPNVIVRSFSILVQPNTPARDLWQNRPYWLSSDVTDEPLADSLGLTLLSNTAGVRSALLMPLGVGAKRVGMLLVFNKKGDTGFSDRDALNLRPLAAQVAIAIENIRLAEQERIRETELSGLQEISQVFSAIGHTDQFYASVNERLARMMNVGICGILLHDVENSQLVAQVPFTGMDATDYAIGIPDGSPMGLVYGSEDYWYTNTAATDRLVYSAGIAESLAVAGIYKLLIVPLPAAGQRIGVVQAANPRDGRDFDDEDARLLQIYASQVGTMIENARLFRAVQEQVNVSESIRRIAEYAGAVNTPEDSLAPLLREVARLTASPQSFVNVIDPTTGNLNILPEYAFNLDLRETLITNTYTPGFERSVTLGRRPFFSHDLPNDKRVLAAYRRFNDQLDLRTVVMVPLVVGDQSLGEMGVLNRTNPPYSEDDVRTMQAVAVHIAAALDRVRLARSTGQNMRRRLQELDAISRVSNELAQTLDLDQTLEVIRSEAIRATEASGSSIVLFRSAHEWRSPTQPSVERRLGDPLLGIAPIEMDAFASPGTAVIVEDYEETGVTKGNPARSRSGIAVAFSYEENVVGVLHLWDQEPNLFDKLAAGFLETLASKASLSYGNSARYLENQERSNRLARRVEQLNQIFELGQMLQTTVDTVTMLEAIAFSVGQSIGYDIVVILMVDPEVGVLRRVTQAGLPLEAFEKSRELTVPRGRLEELFASTQFRISESYFFPIQQVPEWYSEDLIAFGAGVAVTRTMHPASRSDWHDGDLLLVPLFGAGGDLLGVMSLDRPYDGKRPDRGIIEILEIFAHQASNTLENTRLYMSSVQNAEQEARLNQILGAVSSTFDIQQIIRGVATGTMGLVPLNRLTVSLFGASGRDFEVIRVERGTGADSGELKVFRETHVNLHNTALSYSFEMGEEHLYTRDDPGAKGLVDLERWWQQGEHISLIMPLIAGGLVLGSMHLGSDVEDPSAFTDHYPVVRRVASLTGIAVQNARLFADTRARTERLSLLNRVSVALAQSLDTENVMEIALKEITILLEMTRARAYLVERDAHVIRAIVDVPRGDEPPGEIFPYDERPLFAEIIQRPVTVIIPNLAKTEGYAHFPDYLEDTDAAGFALLPMIVAGQTTGIFELLTTQRDVSYDPEKLELAQIIANQAAIGVLNASLLEQSMVRTRELETLLEATQATAYTLDIEEVFQTVTRLALQALDLEAAAVMLYDNIEDALSVEIAIDRDIEQGYGESRELLPLRDHPAKGHTINQKQIVISRQGDQSADPSELADMQRRGVRERMFVPLIVRDQVLGLLQVDLRSRIRTFTHREVRMAQALGVQAATAIENARLSTETAAQVEQSLILNDIGFAISSTMDVVDIVEIVREQIMNLTRAEEVALALYDSEKQVISFPMALRDGMDISLPSRPLGEDEISFVVRNRRPLSLGGISPSTEEVRRNLGIVSAYADAGRFLAMPLVAGDEALGVLAIHDTQQRRPFGLNDQRVLNAIASQVAAALQNARLFERVRSFAAELNARVQERTQELQEERDRLEALYQITAELGRTLDVDRIYLRALEMTVDAVGANAGFVTLVDPVDDRLHTSVSWVDGRSEIVRKSSGGTTTTSVLSEQSVLRTPAERFATWLVEHERSMLVEDLTNTPYWDVHHPGASEWHSAMGVALESNEEIQGVMVLFGRNRRQFNVPQLRLLLAAANQIASSINNAELYGLIRDQNDRMTALLRAEQEEAEKNSAILEGIADGVLLADATGAIVLFNKAAEIILDIPRDFALGQTLNRLGTQYPNAYRWVSRLSQWIGEQHGINSDLTIDRLEIGSRVVSVRAAPVRIGDDPLGTVAVFRDVTRDVEVDRMKSEFISNVSHELRTPMTSIMGYAELLLGGAAGAPTDTQKRFLTTIKSNADRLASLVGDLLNISRIDSGRDRMQIQPLDVVEVLEEVASSVGGRAQHVEKHIDLHMNLEPGLPMIHADRYKVDQIFSNIVENAYNYTRPGGKIEISAQSRMSGERSQVLISVRDNGIGIPEEFRQRIFNRFERYEENALVMEVAGTGLGLSIVKALVEMHEGEVWFESVVNEGTTFYIALPVDGPAIAAPTDDSTLRASLN